MHLILARAKNQNDAITVIAHSHTHPHTQHTQHTQQTHTCKQWNEIFALWHP